jgi:ABC-type uncharacterized transport system ATPase subunit
MRHFTADGKTVLFATHNLAEADDLANRGLTALETAWLKGAE